MDALAVVAADDPYATVAGIDLAGAGAMIAEGLRERDATVRLDDQHAPGDAPDELDEDLRALVDRRVGLLPLGDDASLPCHPERAGGGVDRRRLPRVAPRAGSAGRGPRLRDDRLVRCYRYDGDRPGTPA